MFHLTDSDAVDHDREFLTSARVVSMLMRTIDLVQLLACLFVIDGEMRSEIGEKDLSRVTQLSGAKLESKQEF